MIIQVWRFDACVLNLSILLVSIMIQCLSNLSSPPLFYHVTTAPASKLIVCQLYVLQLIIQWWCVRLDCNIEWNQIWSYSIIVPTRDTDPPKIYLLIRSWLTRGDHSILLDQSSVPQLLYFSPRHLCIFIFLVSVFFLRVRAPFLDDKYWQKVSPIIQKCKNKKS